MPISFVFFGTSEFSVIILEELKKAGFLPSLVVTIPDSPQGRGLSLTPPPVKKWVIENKIEFLQPEKLDSNFTYTLSAIRYQLFIVASYGKILPASLLAIPKHGTLNVHPSLLPKLRGASPIQSAILEDEKETGVTIMLMDKEMDHGPIIDQYFIGIQNWPPKASDLEKTLAHEGGKLLAEIIPQWVAGTIDPQEQDHSGATFTKKISKEDGLIDMEADPYKNFLKIKALSENPGTYFFTEKGGKKIRVKIVDADYAEGKLLINRVIPEGKKEMSYEDFMRG